MKSLKLLTIILASLLILSLVHNTYAKGISLSIGGHKVVSTDDLNPVKVLESVTKGATDVAKGLGVVLGGAAKVINGIAQPTTKAIGDVIGVTGDVVAKAVHDGGGALGDVAQDFISSQMKTTTQILSPVNAAVSTVGKLTKDGLDKVAYGVQHFAKEYDKHIIQQGKKEIKHALPYAARVQACIVTLCYSEVRLRKIKQERQDKYNRMLDEYKAKLAKANAVEKQTYYKEFLEELKKFKKELEAQRDLYLVQLGYLTYIHVYSEQEVQRREELGFLNESANYSVSHLFESDPDLGELVIYMTPYFQSEPEDMKEYTAALVDYAKATGRDMQDALAYVLSNVQPSMLKDLSFVSYEMISPIEQKLGATLIEIASQEIQINEVVKLIKK